MSDKTHQMKTLWRTAAHLQCKASRSGAVESTHAEVSRDTLPSKLRLSTGTESVENRGKERMLVRLRSPEVFWEISFIETICFAVPHLLHALEEKQNTQGSIWSRT